MKGLEKSQAMQDAHNKVFPLKNKYHCHTIGNSSHFGLNGKQCAML